MSKDSEARTEVDQMLSSLGTATSLPLSTSVNTDTDTAMATLGPPSTAQQTCPLILSSTDDERTKQMLGLLEAGCIDHGTYLVTQSEAQFSSVSELPGNDISGQAFISVGGNHSVLESSNVSHSNQTGVPTSSMSGPLDLDHSIVLSSVVSTSTPLEMDESIVTRTVPSSSACVVNMEQQFSTEHVPLSQDDGLQSQDQMWSVSAGTLSPASVGLNRHYIASSSCNAVSTHSVVDLPPSSSSSAAAAVEPIPTCPSQLHLVPVVYVNSDGLPMCYEVIQPVASPSHLQTSSAPSLSSTHANGSVGKSPVPAVAAINADSVDWTLSLKSPLVEKHNVEDEVIAACHSLTSQSAELTSVLQNRLQGTKPATKSTSEICVAQVLASLSRSSADLQSQLRTTPSCVVSTKKASSFTCTPASAGKNSKRSGSTRKNNLMNTVTNASNGGSAELSTINMTDINGLKLPDHLSPISKRSVVVSTPSLPSCLSRSVTVTSSTNPIASSLKRMFYRPMKRPSEVSIRYDETTKRYVQTVKNSADRRKSLAFPGSQSDVGNDMFSCRRSMPIAVALGNLAENTRNETTDKDVSINQRHRLSLKKNTAESTSRSLLGSDEAMSDLSSMEIVTRCCLGTSESPTLEWQQSQPIDATKLDSAVPCQARRSRSKSSQPASEVAKYSATDGEPDLLTGNSSKVEITLVGKVDPSVSAPSNTKVKKGRSSDKIAAKDHPTEKGLEKPPRRTSPRHATDPSPVSFVEMNPTRKPRGRLQTKKPAETSEEKKTGRRDQRGSLVDPQAQISAENTSSVRRRQSTSRKNNKRNNCLTDLDNNTVKAATSNSDNVELSTIDMSDVRGLVGAVQSSSVDPAHGTPKRSTTRRKGRTIRNKVQTLDKKQIPSNDSVSSLVGRKRRRSSRGENAEAEQTVNVGLNAARLPDIECFLTGPPQDSDYTDTTLDYNVDDSCLQQISCSSTQHVIPAVGSTSSKENAEHVSASSHPVLPTSTSTLLSIGQKSSTHAEHSSPFGNILLSPASTSAMLSSGQMSSAYFKCTSSRSSLLLTTTTSTTASSGQTLSPTSAQHSDSVSTGVSLPLPTSIATSPFGGQTCSALAQHTSMPNDVLLPASSTLLSTGQISSERSSLPGGTLLPPSTTTHSSGCQTSSTVSVLQSSPQSSDTICVSEAHPTDEVHCPTVSDVGRQERECELTSSQTFSHSMEKHVSSIIDSNPLSAGSAVSNTSEFDDPQPRKKRRLSADVNPDVINKFMKLLSTEKRDKILELARRNQPSSPTS